MHRIRYQSEPSSSRRQPSPRTPSRRAPGTYHAGPRPCAAELRFQMLALPMILRRSNNCNRLPGIGDGILDRFQCLHRNGTTQADTHGACRCIGSDPLPLQHYSFRILMGVHRADTAERRMRVRLCGNDFRKRPICPLTCMWRVYAQLGAHLAASGNIGAHDLLNSGGTADEIRHSSNLCHGHYGCCSGNRHPPRSRPSVPRMADLAPRREGYFIWRSTARCDWKARGSR